ncbi:MAG: hypothetical protein ABFD92_20965 [Planctomycetaceae bacterium]
MGAKTLTLDERARRRAKRKSNQVKSKYPLLAQAGVVEDWMTTTDEAREQIERFDQAAAEWAAQRAKNREDALQLAAELRAQVAQRVDADTLALYDEHLARVYPPDYEVGFWQRVLDGKFDIHDWLACIENIRALGKSHQGSEWK